MRQMLVGQDFVCMILKTEKYCFMHFDISSNSIKKYEEIGWSSIRIAWPTGSINKTSLHNTSSFWICWKNWFAQLLALICCFFCLFGFYFYRGHSHSFPFIGCLDHESYDCCSIKEVIVKIVFWKLIVCSQTLTFSKIVRIRIIHIYSPPRL